MNIMIRINLSIMLVTIVYSATTHAGPTTAASNVDSITNTRHNLTQSYLGVDVAWMDTFSRNNYGDVCVYCHTPHAANSQTQLQNAPLWNRTMPNPSGYQTYDKVGTSSNTAVTDPGANSLTCLSCHDGTIAIDSIINMPSSGRSNQGQETAQNDSFLWSWYDSGIGSVPDAFYGGHGTLDTAGADSEYGSCMACHSPSGMQHDPTI